MDLGLSSMQVDRPERGFSYSRQAPLDMRMDPSAPRTAADLVAEAAERELADLFRAYGEERYARRSRGRSSAAGRASRSPTTATWWRSSARGPHPGPVRGRPPGQARVPGAAHRRQRRAREPRAGPRRGVRAARARRPTRRDRLPLARGPAVKRFMRAHTQGCICPPDMPVCGCGREAEAALLTAEGPVPRPAELDRNPRARSALPARRCAAWSARVSTRAAARSAARAGPGAGPQRAAPPRRPAGPAAARPARRARSARAPRAAGHPDHRARARRRSSG